MEKQENKTICPHCEKIHPEDDSLIMFAEMSAQIFTQHAFPSVWKDTKTEMKEMSKKEIAEEMFYTGAVEMLIAFLGSMEEQKQKKED